MTNRDEKGRFTAKPQCVNCGDTIDTDYRYIHTDGFVYCNMTCFDNRTAKTMEKQPPVNITTPSNVGWIHGLPIAPSQVASDLLAAFHMGFSSGLTFYRELSRPGPPGEVVLGGGYMGPEGEDEGFNMNVPSGLSPLATAAWRQAHGFPDPIFPESDNPADHPAYQQMQDDMRMKGLGDEEMEGG